MPGTPGETPTAPESGLKTGWNNLRTRVGNGLSGLRERVGNMSNPITGPRVKTAAKTLGILAAAGLATGLVVVGGKKAYDAMGSDWEATSGPLTQEICNTHMTNTRGDEMMIYNCNEGSVAICSDEGTTSGIRTTFSEITTDAFETVETPTDCKPGEYRQIALEKK